MKYLLPLLLFVNYCVAETKIYLENGDEIDGEVFEVTLTEVKVRFIDKREKSIYVKQIAGIRKDGVLNNGPFTKETFEKLFPNTYVEKTEPPPDSSSNTEFRNDTDINTEQTAKILEGKNQYRIAIQAKPFNFIVQNFILDHQPFPTRIAVARIRLAEIFGFEFEPMLIINKSGWGFLVGPTIMQSDDPSFPLMVTLSFKYNYIKFTEFGNESKYFIEITRQIKAGPLLIGFGGSVGLGLNEIITSSTNKIIGTKQGVTWGLLYDMGFAL